LETQNPLRLMVVHAHPDDELFGTGGTFPRYADEGIQTILVCATLGEEGENHDSDLDAAAVKPRLGEIRAGELERSAAALRIGVVELLGYRDSGMAGAPENANPSCFHQADLTEATARLVRLVRRYRPQVLVSYNDFGGYGHPDHIKAHKITREAFDRAADPAFAAPDGVPPWQPLKLYETAMIKQMIRSWRDRAHEQHERRAAARAAEAAKNGTEAPAEEPWNPSVFDEMELHGLDLDEVTTSYDISRYRTEILAAMRCHRTQFSPDSDIFKEQPGDVPEWMRKEYFRLIRSLVPANGHESDLFAGLR
jgi:LmbE family N-acetylglucosaminyl deacetylase